MKFFDADHCGAPAMHITTARDRALSARCDLFMFNGRTYHTVSMEPQIDGAECPIADEPRSSRAIASMIFSEQKEVIGAVGMAVLRSELWKYTDAPLRYTHRLMLTSTILFEQIQEALLVSGVAEADCSLSHVAATSDAGAIRLAILALDKRFDLFRPVIERVLSPATLEPEVLQALSEAAVRSTHGERSE